MKLDDSLSLEEKLAKIDALMESIEVQNKKQAEAGLPPIDPADELMCDSCQ